MRQTETKSIFILSSIIFPLFFSSWQRSQSNSCSSTFAATKYQRNKHAKAHGKYTKSNNHKPITPRRCENCIYRLLFDRKNKKPSSNSKQKWEKQKGRKQRNCPTLWTLKSLGANNSNNHRQQELTGPVNQDRPNRQLNRPMFFSLLRSKFAHTHKNQTPRNENETKKRKCTWMEELEGVQNPTSKPPNAKWKPCSSTRRRYRKMWLLVRVVYLYEEYNGVWGHPVPSFARLLLSISHSLLFYCLPSGVMGALLTFLICTLF